MHKATRTAVTLFLITQQAFAFAPGEALVEFRGNESRRTETFETTGPWLVTWTWHEPGLAKGAFELRLFTSDGEYLGQVAAAETWPQRRKLFEDTGEFYFQVVSNDAEWFIKVLAVDHETAGQLTRRGQGKETIGDRARIYARHVRDDSFQSWRPQGDDTLLLFEADDSRGYRVEFDNACTGLSDATSLSFMSAAGSGPFTYDSIMLEDGTICSFGKVIPTVFD